MRFDISRSLNGEQIVYIARDANGVVRLRANSLEELQEAIKSYNPTVKVIPKKEPEVKAHEDESSSNSQTLEEIVGENSQENPTDAKELASLLVSEPETDEKTSEEKKEFLKSDLKEKVEEKKKRTSKGSFWDKLK